jgi:hypothetical protein
MSKYIPLIAVAAAFATTFYAYNALDPCGNQVLQQVTSPDGQFKAVIFERNCGATTGYSTQVSVLPSAAILPNKSGNVFVTDDRNGSARSGSSGLRLWAKWLAARHLKIAYGSGETVFYSEPKYEDIAVSYEKR